jgi:hypothetical protein
MSLSWLLEVPGIFILIAVLWVAVSVLLAWISGWIQLARQFGVSKLPKGYLFKWVSGGIGRANFPVRYRGALIMLLNDDGIGFSVLLPFRAAAKPFFIPWEQIAFVKPGRALFNKGTQLHVRGQWATITVLGDPGHVINDWVKEHPDRVTVQGEPRENENSD